MSALIHRFSRDGVHVVIDVNSGAVHVLDGLAYAVSGLLTSPMPPECPEAVLEQLPDIPREQVAEAYGELYALYRDGSFLSEDDYVPRIVPTGSPVKSLCLNVSHDCNLRCRYCFASTGDFGTGRKIMPFATAKAAVDFVVQRSGTRRNIEIDFFGGEPLMAFDTVTRTVEYARSLERAHNKNFRFTITTNGMLLDDAKIDYINKNMSNAVLSLDGRREINDRMRPTPNGAGSYDVIVPKFKKLVAGRGDRDYYVRGTFTHQNTDFASDALHIVDLGFDSLSIEPVVSEKGTPWALQESDLPRIRAEYDRLSAEALRREREGRPFRFFHFMIDLEQGPCIIKRLRGCGAGFEYVAVTPEGDLYPCHQFVGNPDYKLGNLFDGTFDTTLSERFGRLNVYTRKDCRTCWAKFYCSGGCSASNFQTNGDIAKPYALGCELERKRVECAIYLKAQAMLDASAANG